MKWIALIVQKSTLTIQSVMLVLDSKDIMYHVKNRDKEGLALALHNIQTCYKLKICKVRNIKLSIPLIYNLFKPSAKRRSHVPK